MSPASTLVIFGQCYINNQAMLGQEDEQVPFCLHLAKFSVENESSLREPPSLDTSIKLMNNFAMDGFVSTSEPVLIRLEDRCDK